MIVDDEKFYSKPQAIIKKLLGLKTKKNKFLRRFLKD